MSNSLPSTQTQGAILPTSTYLLLIAPFALVSVASVMKGIHLLKRAKHADQGAKGEEDTAQILSKLEHAGWQLEYNMMLQGGLGDADIVCISPKGQAYVIDVKSHRGEVFPDGGQLKRRMGGATYSFEKDFLQQAIKQALQVKKQKKLKFVTPIVAFSDAKVSVPPDKLRGVYVVEKAKLVALLTALG